MCVITQIEENHQCCSDFRSANTRRVGDTLRKSNGARPGQRLHSCGQTNYTTNT